MATADRRSEVHRWKQQVLAHYLEDHQLASFDIDGDNAFFVPNQLIVDAQAASPVRSRLERYGARRVSGAVRLTRLGVSAQGSLSDAPAAAEPSRPTTTGGQEVVDLDPSHGVDVAELALELSGQHPGAVAPNHLVTGLQRRMGWPDGDPEPAPAALPPLPSPLPDGGAGVTVAVIDTGWPSAPPPDLNWFGHDTDHATAPGEVDQAGRPVRHVDQLDADRDGYLDVEAGHGIFVAGLIRRMAPRARLVFLKALNSDGVGTELGVARAIRFATARGVDIINLSLGFYTVRNATPSGVERAVADARAAGIALVAAAGNDGLSSPSYPAAFPGVTGVGALTADGQGLASFSNRGDWVNVHAPGERVQSAFVRGQEDQALTDDGGSDRFASNTALWSGTSFACGYVSGHLARALSGPAPASGPTSFSDRAEAVIDALPVMMGASRRLDPAPAF